MAIGAVMAPKEMFMNITSGDPELMGRGVMELELILAGGGRKYGFKTSPAQVGKMAIMDAKGSILSLATRSNNYVSKFINFFTKKKTSPAKSLLEKAPETPQVQKKPPSDGSKELEKILDETKCFTGTTLIAMATGPPKAIQDLEKGDQVLTWSTETGTTIGEVTNTFESHPPDVYEIRFQNEQEEEVVIEGTANHPFFVVERRDFIPVEEIKPGQHFLDQSGEKQRFLGLTKLRGPPTGEWTTYNFEVKPHHTYFVLDPKQPNQPATLVHNQGTNCIEKLGRAQIRIQKWREYKASNPNGMDLKQWMQHTRSQPWGHGPKTMWKFDRSHGNYLGNQPATLYAKFRNGVFQKWG